MSKENIFAPKLTKKLTHETCPLAAAKWSALLPKKSALSGSPLEKKKNCYHGSSWTSIVSNIILKAFV